MAKWKEHSRCCAAAHFFFRHVDCRSLVFNIEFYMDIHCRTRMLGPRIISNSICQCIQTKGIKSRGCENQTRPQPLVILTNFVNPSSSILYAPLIALAAPHLTEPLGSSNSKLWQPLLMQTFGLFQHLLSLQNLERLASQKPKRPQNLLFVLIVQHLSKPKSSKSSGYR